MSAAVLLSGGLDSAICLHWAIARYESVFAVSIDYGQRHVTELVSARRISARAGVRLLEVKAQIPWAPSSLTGGGADEDAMRFTTLGEALDTIERMPMVARVMCDVETVGD